MTEPGGSIPARHIFIVCEGFDPSLVLHSFAMLGIPSTFRGSTFFCLVEIRLQRHPACMEKRMSENVRGGEFRPVPRSDEVKEVSKFDLALTFLKITLTKKFFSVSVKCHSIYHIKSRNNLCCTKLSCNDSCNCVQPFK